MKRITALALTLLMIVGLFTAFPTSAETEIHRKNNYVYIIKNDGVQILRYYGKASKVTIPSKIDGIKVVKLGIDYTDEIKEMFDELDYAGFSCNKYIKTVVVPSGIHSFGDGVFSGCKNLKKVVFKKGITEFTREMFSNCVKLETVSIPNSVTTIGDCTFANCTKLKTINLPSSVTTIYDGAFYKSGLTTFHIGKNLKAISVDFGGTFYKTNLKKFTISKGNKNYSVKNGVLYNKNKSVLICYPCKKSCKTFTLPNTVNKISSYAFTGSKYLKSVVISKNVTKIGCNSFSECKKLSRIVFKNKKSLKINGYAFSDCTGLKKVTLPQNIVKISKYSLGYYSANSKMKKIKNFTIKGYKGTAAEKYAKKNGFKFVALG